MTRLLYRRNGILGFYRGVIPSMSQSATEKLLYYYGYEMLTRLYFRLQGAPGPIANVVIGYMSEAMHLPFSVPFESVMLKLQTSDKLTLSAVIEQLWADGGLPALYRGIGTYPLLCFKPAIQSMVFDQIKRIVLRNRRVGGGRDNGPGPGTADLVALAALPAFMLGAVARAIATVSRSKAPLDNGWLTW